MRGFRASRAKQNVMAFRHGHSQPLGGNGSINGHGGSSQHHTSVVKALPDWLKTPETLAKEREAAQPRGPHLTVIQGGRAESPAVQAKPKSTVAKPAKKKSVAKANPVAKKSAAKKPARAAPARTQRQRKAA